LSAALFISRNPARLRGRKVSPWLTTVQQQIEKADEGTDGLKRLVTTMLDKYSFALDAIRRKLGELEPPSDSPFVQKVFPKGWEKAHEGPLPEGFWDMPSDEPVKPKVRRKRRAK
jgi:hypothetical protein